MALLPSEICRLILGFLEDEQLFKTYETFISECKYLDECRIYSEKGIKFQKSVHGKNLIQHLNQNYERTFHTVGTDTSSDLSIEKNYIEPVSQNNETDQTSFYRRKSLKRKNTLISPVKCNKPPPDTVIDDFDETLLDIDSFIKNLCDNDFPEKLAQSINDLNSKKNVLELSDNSMEKSPQVHQLEPILEKNDLIRTYSETNSHDSQQEINKIYIGNEEISTLAEHFSEPIVDTLFDVFNLSQQNDVCTENEVILVEEKSFVIEKKMDPTPGTSMTMEKNNLEKASENFKMYPTPGTSMTMEKNNLEKASENFEEEKIELFNGLDFLVKAATNVQNESLDEKLSVTSTPSKKSYESIAKRPKTIREIYDEEHKEDCVVNSGSKMEKKSVNKSVKRSNRTYFYDFYQDIKNDIEEDEKELPTCIQ